MTDYIAKGAEISPCGKYRWRLWREWRGTGKPENWREDGPKSCVFVMLNPSTADADDDDPTIRRCVSFAQRWGFDRIDVVNLFAFRATDPRALLALGWQDEPVGVLNSNHIERTVWDAGIVVCAWGAHGGHLGQDETALGWIEDALEGKPLVALGVTKDGFPRHPLYVAGDTVPQPYAGRGR